MFLVTQETFQWDPPNPPACLVGGGDTGSMSSLTSNSGDLCRICHCTSEPDAPMISPCVCSGSLKFVHQSCLQQWIKSADTKSCELCKYDFQMTTKIKPFRKVCTQSHLANSHSAAYFRRKRQSGPLASFRVLFV